MADTPAKAGTFGFCTSASNIRVERWTERVFKPLGLTLQLDEVDQFKALRSAQAWANS